MYSSRKFKQMVSFQQRLGQPKVPVRHGSPTWGAQLSCAHGEALPPTLRTSVRFLLQEVVAEHCALLQAAGSQLALDVTAYSVGGLSMGSSPHRKEYICRIAHYVRRPSALVPLLCSGSGQKPQTDEPCCWEPPVHSICDKSCQVDRDCRVLLHLRPCACPQKWQLQDICQLKKGHGFHEAVGEELGCQAAPVMQE